jgi:DNA-binding protein HU-beta
MSNKELKTISDYANMLSERHEVSGKVIEVFIKDLFTMIKKDIENENNVRINNFGTFKLTTRSARPERQGRNPSTGEAITIPAQPEKQVISFKQSKVSK